MLTEYKLTLSHDYHECFVQLLKERSEAMLLKLESVKYSYLKAMYASPEITSRLKIMHEQLEQKQETLSGENDLLTAEMERFKLLNQDELNKLTTEYKKIQKEIQQGKWTLSNLE